MSETNEIVAKVTEPKREPRPTWYFLVNEKARPWQDGFILRDDNPKNHDPHPGWLLVRIPGELESAQAARIEQARDAVIDAAVAHKHAEIHTVDRTPSFANLCDAIADLKALTTQENANG